MQVISRTGRPAVGAPQKGTPSPWITSTRTAPTTLLPRHQRQTPQRRTVEAPSAPSKASPAAAEAPAPASSQPLAIDGGHRRRDGGRGRTRRRSVQATEARLRAAVNAGAVPDGQDGQRVIRSRRRRHRRHRHRHGCRRPGPPTIRDPTTGSRPTSTTGPRRPGADDVEMPEPMSEGRPSVEAAERALVRRPQIGDTMPIPTSPPPGPSRAPVARSATPRRASAAVASAAAVSGGKRRLGPAIRTAPVDDRQGTADGDERTRQSAVPERLDDAVAARASAPAVLAADATSPARPGRDHGCGDARDASRSRTQRQADRSLLHDRAGASRAWHRSPCSKGAT